MTTDITRDERSFTLHLPDGADAWTCVWDGPVKPFLHPVRTPDGGLVSQDAPPDHPWHHGLWFAVKFVNEDNFWEEYDPFGTVRPAGPPSFQPAGEGLQAVTSYEWIRPAGGQPVLVDERTLTHRPLEPDAYAIDVTVTLRPRVDVVLDRTPYQGWGGYGGLALRGPGDWHDTRLLLSDGTMHERIIGEPAPWCDLSGTFPSGRTGGVAVLDHPANPRHPVPWYGSTRSAVYGDEGWSNFFNAAFLFHEPLALSAGQELTVRHRVVVHDGIAHLDRVGAWAAAYEERAR